MGGGAAQLYKIRISLFHYNNNSLCRGKQNNKTNTVQIQYKYSTNTVLIQYKYSTNTVQIRFSRL